MSGSEIIINSLRDLFPDWNITYEEYDEKYHLESSLYESNLNNEKLELIKKLGLDIFSVGKCAESVIIRLISTGGGFS